MPYNWTAERERHMLLLAISSANLRPSADTWSAVADLLGEGLTPSAVSQKYYKLRNESAKLFEGRPGSTPSTPTKRKRSGEDDSEKSPTKRAKQPVKKEDWNGEPFSDASGSPERLKAEDATTNVLHAYPNYNTMFAPEDYFRYGQGQVKEESSGGGGSSSSLLI